MTTALAVIPEQIAPQSVLPPLTSIAPRPPPCTTRRPATRKAYRSDFASFQALRLRQL